MGVHRKSFGSYKLRSIIVLLARYRPSRSGTTSASLPHVSDTWTTPEPTYQGLQLISADHGTVTNMIEDDGHNFHPPAPLPLKPSFLARARWLLGSILSLFLPFWEKKCAKLKRLEGEVEVVAEEVENMAEVIEKVATVVEKVSAEVADILPDGGNLKEGALLVEHVSKDAAKDAQLTIYYIRKVDDLKQDMETLVEPLIDQGKIVEKEAGGL
ncbi:hypothetical protein HHK36_009551 [Tetracentron sinense]|uniref:Uncharacterized protein n=1 Tax=Tetracentron sinense TaxID=13715 RepID=A0A834ZGE8_TETSI|nr:hypothetical protein HHK36_009551 [Tetracentron sinense]